MTTRTIQSDAAAVDIISDIASDYLSDIEVVIRRCVIDSIEQITENNSLYSTEDLYRYFHEAVQTKITGSVIKD